MLKKKSKNVNLLNIDEFLSDFIIKKKEQNNFSNVDIRQKSNVEYFLAFKEFFSIIKNTTNYVKLQHICEIFECSDVEYEDERCDIMVEIIHILANPLLFKNSTMENLCFINKALDLAFECKDKEALELLDIKCQ